MVLKGVREQYTIDIIAFPLATGGDSRESATLWVERFLKAGNFRS